MFLKTLDILDIVWYNIYVKERRNTMKIIIYFLEVAKCLVIIIANLPRAIRTIKGWKKK